MQKILILFAIFGVVFASCGSSNDDMKGEWQMEVAPKDNPTETNTMVFVFVVNENGEIVSEEFEGGFTGDFKEFKIKTKTVIKDKTHKDGVTQIREIPSGVELKPAKVDKNKGKIEETTNHHEDENKDSTHKAKFEKKEK